MLSPPEGALAPAPGKRVPFQKYSRGAAHPVSRRTQG